MSFANHGKMPGPTIFVLLMLFICTQLTTAFPVLNALPKRQIVTRVHTASTTNTVTDVYSTTTEVVVAPTVEFIISGDVTMTTTLPLADGSVPTVAPSATITVQLAAASVGNNPAATTSSQCETTITYGGSSAILTKTVSAIPTNVVETTNTVSNTYNSGSNSVSSSANPSANGNDAATSTTSAAAQGSQGTTTYSSSEVTETEPTANTETSSNTNVAFTAADSTTQATSSPEISSTASSATSASSTSQASTALSSGVSTTATKSSGSISGSPTALVYSPYNNDNSCKGSSDVYSDLQFIQSKGVSKIRIYGTDCNSLETVLSAAKDLGLKVNQGLWIGSSGVDSIDDSVSDLVNYGQSNGWDVFDFITIGNEAVLSGYCTVDELISKISTVRQTIEAAGYSGKFTTSEAPVTFENYPSLCTEADIDFVGINTHAYFDENSSADTAGSFVVGQQALIKKVCGTSNVVITETGYPSSGVQNGGNIPSPENQVIAVQDILDETGEQVTILSTFNDYWKQPGTYGIEQYFGIGDDLSTV
ncbi:LAFE_0D03686g1_1 [Lachancea fermentati]|uniref:LAFE_0D03686g1_1 n=1 Tax=Lachancea fermentati TaxID=4955 RepID=A0A1G4MAW4_LACFM|nr:LAFE_0D03686g1_1 [Lachancea fermentati]